MSSIPSEGARRIRQLRDWYRLAARDLPWRHTDAPYPVWISEIMLQQTQVATVLPRYTEWLVRFPDIRSVAKAHEDTVMKAWEGLGYYRRARFLHAAARRIMAECHGIFPRSFADILALPGIGRSTAGAIASICFGAHTPVLDGNVKRVLLRWHGRPGASGKELWQWAQAAIDQADNPGNWNQAMMELGATICTAKQPNCHACPVAEDCTSAFCADRTTGKASPPKVHDLFWHVMLHLCPSRGIWLTRRPTAGIWGGLWTPPIRELAAPPGRAADHIHLLTHRRLHLYGHICTALPTGPGLWASSLGQVAVPTGMRRLLERHGVTA